MLPAVHLLPPLPFSNPTPGSYATNALASCPPGPARGTLRHTGQEQQTALGLAADVRCGRRDVGKITPKAFPPPAPKTAPQPTRQPPHVPSLLWCRWQQVHPASTETQALIPCSLPRKRHCWGGAGDLLCFNTSKTDGDSSRGCGYGVSTGLQPRCASESRCVSSLSPAARLRVGEGRGMGSSRPHTGRCAPPGTAADRQHLAHMAGTKGTRPLFWKKQEQRCSTLRPHEINKELLMTWCEQPETLLQQLQGAAAIALLFFA